MIKSITILQTVDIGKNNKSDTYTIGYMIKSDSSGSIEWLEPIAWDNNGMSTNRNICKYPLLDIEIRNIHRAIKVFDRRFASDRK